jgi:ATP-dependent helicase YprA (DUF1998 family)
MTYPAGAEPVIFSRYTSQEKAEERDRSANNHLDIILTNFMMLELMMIRQDQVDKEIACASSRKTPA